MPCKASGIPVYQGRYANSAVKPLSTYYGGKGAGCHAKVRTNQKVSLSDGTRGKRTEEGKSSRNEVLNKGRDAQSVKETRTYSGIPTKKTQDRISQQNGSLTNCDKFITRKQNVAQKNSLKHSHDSVFESRNTPDNKGAAPRKEQEVNAGKREPTSKSISHLKPPASPSFRRVNLNDGPQNSKQNASFKRRVHRSRSPTIYKGSAEARENPRLLSPKPDMDRGNTTKSNSGQNLPSDISPKKSKSFSHTPTNNTKKGNLDAQEGIRKMHKTPYFDQEIPKEQASAILKSYNSNPILDVTYHENKSVKAQEAKKMCGNETKINTQKKLIGSIHPTKSSLIHSNRGRASIVNRVMTSTETKSTYNAKPLKAEIKSSGYSPLPKRRTFSSGVSIASKPSTPLGSRNNILRSSFESHKAESTTDSGCNSPSYGSHSSLNNDALGASPLIKRKTNKNIPPKREEKKGMTFNVQQRKITNKKELLNNPEKKLKIETAEIEDKDISLEENRGSKSQAKGLDKKLSAASTAQEAKFTIKETQSKEGQKIWMKRRDEFLVKRSINCNSDDEKQRGGKKRLESETSSISEPSTKEEEEEHEEEEEEATETRIKRTPSPATDNEDAETTSSNCNGTTMNGNIKHGNGSVKDVKDPNPTLEADANCYINHSNLPSDIKQRFPLTESKTVTELRGQKITSNPSSKTAIRPSHEPERELEEVVSLSGKEWTRSFDMECSESFVPQTLHHPFKDKKENANDDRESFNVDKNSTLSKSDCHIEEKMTLNGINVNKITSQSLSHIIDAAVLDNLKLNGNVLNNQFDAIITTLKKVAESMELSSQNSSLMTQKEEGKQRVSVHSLDESKQHFNNAYNDYLNKQYNRSASAPSPSELNSASQPLEMTQNNKCIIELRENNLPYDTHPPNCSSIIKIKEGSNPPEFLFKINGRSSVEKESNPAKKNRKSTENLTRSRELLHHLEEEYRQIKGVETTDKKDKRPATGFDRVPAPNPVSESCSASPPSLEGGKNPPLVISKRRSGALNGFFPFLQKRNRGQISARRVTYKDLTLNQMGIPPVPNEPPPRVGKDLCIRESSILSEEEKENCEEEEQDETPRSLSLPKSFLSEKNVTRSIKHSFPSVVFPWKKDEAPEGTYQDREDDFQESRSPRGTRVGHEKKEIKFEEVNGSRGSYPQHPVNGGTDKGEKGLLPDQGPLPPHPQLPPASTRGVSLSRSEWDIHRPWSQDESASHAISQSSCRLSEEDEQFLERRSDHRVEALSMPYVVTSEALGHVTSEGKFQKFKKTLSLRLAKKGSRAESPNRGGDRAPTGCTPPPGDDRQTPQPDDMGLSQNLCYQGDEHVKPSYFKFGHPLFRSSKERKKGKFGDSRASKCNSGDSGDSGIELASGTSTLVGDLGLPMRIDTLPLFNNELNDNGEPADLAPSDPSDVHAKVLRRTRSDMSKSRPLQRHLLAGDPHYRQSLGRQYSSPQPIKVRPFHRLPDYSIESSGVRNPRIKRSKGSTHLRRSVSQPLDLDKSFQAQVSLMKMRIPDEEASVKNQRRRPSVGNLLSEEDNTSEEDAGLSDSEDFRQGFKRGLEEDEEIIVFAEALWDHVSLDSDELVFKAGDLVTVLDSSDKDWWWGRISHRSGWFPASFVRLLVNQEDHQDKDEAQCELEDGEWSSRKLSLSSLSHDQVRANVINEILSTEKDYVKHLKDVVEGYLRQVRKRPDMFSEETINTIFGNMEALFIFHAHFLEQLEHCIDYENPHRSCIGECFIRNKSRFEIYSEYCNNHPSAVSELQVLYQDQKYVHFFEACRLLQEMIDISIDGFLLTPVQKICKYPLQLQELLKYTRPNHPDYSTVHGAMQAMKEVALLVNERRRRMECLEKIALWQKGVEGWEGPDLLDDSSQLIHQGEVTKGVGGSWPKEVALFLFDHQMVYCKRDLLKRNTYVYRGRINTDLCEVIDIPDDPMRSAAFHHAWKIHYLHKSKTYVFTCKTASEKAKWLLAFKRERTLVAMDEASGFVASEKQKQVARMAARNQRTRPKKPRVKTHARKQVMTYAQAQLLVNTEKADENRSNSLPSRSPLIGGEGQKKKGHWFSFGGHKKSRNNSRNQKHNSFHNS